MADRVSNIKIKRIYCSRHTSKPKGGGTKMMFSVVFGCKVWLFLTLNFLGLGSSSCSSAKGMLISFLGPLFFISTGQILISAGSSLISEDMGPDSFSLISIPSRHYSRPFMLQILLLELSFSLQVDEPQPYSDQQGILSSSFFTLSYFLPFFMKMSSWRRYSRLFVYSSQQACPFTFKNLFPWLIEHIFLNFYRPSFFLSSSRTHTIWVSSGIFLLASLLQWPRHLWKTKNSKFLCKTQSFESRLIFYLEIRNLGIMRNSQILSSMALEWELAVWDQPQNDLDSFMMLLYIFWTTLVSWTSQASFAFLSAQKVLLEQQSVRMPTSFSLRPQKNLMKSMMDRNLPSLSALIWNMSCSCSSSLVMRSATFFFLRLNTSSGSSSEFQKFSISRLSLRLLMESAISLGEKNMLKQQMLRSQ